MLATQGLFKEAWETILLENPFPSVCGRVCFHPCEDLCNRREFDAAVAIHSLERFLADTAIRYGIKAGSRKKNAPETEDRRCRRRSGRASRRLVPVPPGLFLPGL